MYVDDTYMTLHASPVNVPRLTTPRPVHGSAATHRAFRVHPWELRERPSGNLVLSFHFLSFSATKITIAAFVCSKIRCQK